MRQRRPGTRGWRGAGRGHAVYVQAPDQFRSTSVQVCGLWPWSVATGTPIVGVPLGPSILTGATVCADPISWFQRAQLISNPSMFMLGKPGLGKSSLAARMALGLAGFGVTPLVLGDLRPDYVGLVQALDGQVIRLDRTGGSLNPLDASGMLAAAVRLTGEERELLIADAHGRRLEVILGLITIVRRSPPSDREEQIVDQAIRLLDERHEGIPVLADLIAMIRAAPPELREKALDRGDDNRYLDRTEDLVSSLQGLEAGTRLGTMFSRPTAEPLSMTRPAVYDVSGIGESEPDVQAAALLTAWSYGFGLVHAAQVLADAGLEPRRHYFVIADELWRAIRAGRGMVDRVDYLTRLNRLVGVGQALISHTMSDLRALPEPADRAKAAGFVERAGMVALAGLPSAEMPALSEVVDLSQAERRMLTSWSNPPSFDAESGRETEPPGRGRFLIKVGGRPGIPLRVALTQRELQISDTNRRWREERAA